MTGVFEAALQFIIRFQLLIVAVKLGHTSLISDFSIRAASGEDTINSL